MSNTANWRGVVIDTTEVSLEEQIEAAQLTYYRGNEDYMIPQMLRDFAAGKFAKAPVPEIRKPKWASQVLLKQTNQRWWVYASADGTNAEALGPSMPTKAEAITAFNDLFGGAP